MKIGVDARVATLDLRGFGRYSRSLLKSLIALPSEIEWFLYTHDPGLGKIFPESGRVRIRVLPNLLSSRSHLALRSASREDRIQLMYFLANNFWFWPACKTLITIHDTEAFERPELFSRTFSVRMLYRFQKFLISRLGADFITVSRASRDDAVSILKVRPERITAVYNGVEHGLFNSRPAGDDLEVRSRLVPDEAPYILFVGAHDYRKNLATLIKAFELLKTGRRIPHKLVLAGSAGSDTKFYPPLKGIAKTAGDDIIFPGYVSDRELPALYRGAQVFVFPSFKEGFGLPVLEAMACGTPVVSSKRSSLPEVVGDAGLLVNPEKESEIADAIFQILSSPSLARELREKGMKQSSRFSWENTGREVLNLIERITG